MLASTPARQHASTPARGSAGVAATLARWFLVLVFGWSIVSKLIDPSVALVAIDAAFLGSGISLSSPLILAAVLGIELLAVSLLAAGLMRAGVFVAAAFIVAATLFVVRLIVTNHDTGCGCGLPGVSGEHELQLAIVRNVLLLSLGWVAYPVRNRDGNSDPGVNHSQGDEL